VLKLAMEPGQDLIAPDEVLDRVRRDARLRLRRASRCRDRAGVPDPSDVNVDIPRGNPVEVNE